MFRPLFDGHKCSLGYAAADWIAANCVHGPGDVQGRAPQIDDERIDVLVDLYELDRITGRRLADEAVLSRMKGWAKSELAGWVAVFEAFGPARFADWDADGQPVGRRVHSPLVKVLATEEEQTENTYAVIAFVVATGKRRGNPVFDGVDFGRDWQTSTRILLPTDDGDLIDEDDWEPEQGGGKIVYCTSGSASKDGGLETFVVADETHLYITRVLRSMYDTIGRNLTKRALSEPWLLQTTTMFRPGELSVAELTFKASREGTGGALLVLHRQARGRMDLADKDKTLRQIREARGGALFVDPERVWRKMTDSRTDPADAERYYLNRERAGSDAWLDPAVWEAQQRLAEHPADREAITVGFDGSINDDATVLVGCRVRDGLLFTLGLWRKPDGPAGEHWSVPRTEVNDRLAEVFKTYAVRMLYADPHEWRSEIEEWVRLYGKPNNRVRAFETNDTRRAAVALDRLRTDLIAGTATHDGDPVMAEHVANAYTKRVRGMVVIRKENDKSSRKIDLVMGAALAYQARADVIAAGAAGSGKKTSTTYYGFS